MEKQYNFFEAERAIQAFWQEKQIYLFDQSVGPLYSIDTPPPTVSGNLHIGHIFSYTHTDIIARYKRMQGYAVFYPFGFDDNGLPTERYVEKKLNVYAPAMGRSAFINLCLQETIGVEEQFKNLWQRMGLSVDWNLLYSTIAPHARKISQESFVHLYNKGYIYRAFEPALYCTTCRTSVAQAELDDQEKNSFFNDIKFTTSEGQTVIIGTTRPEFLASCVAVLYHPADSRYQHLNNQKANVPLFGDQVPFIADEAVDPEKGTGLVMCCSFGDKTDIAWIKKYNLTCKESLGIDGKMVARTGILGGLKVDAAREKVLELLKEQDLIVAQKQVTRAVNVHERCKKEIEYLSLTQWFLKILPFKQQLLELAEQINWYPAHMKSRYINWVQNLSWDWCLSRQRFYGIPFPVWHCAQGHTIVAPVNMLPLDPQEVAWQGGCPTCASREIVPDSDVMDTWNTSSLTPQICFSLFDREKRSPFDITAIQEFFPMSMRPQAHDIIRTWAFYTIVKSWMHYDQIPWKDIVISGHVLSDAQEKLSKSKDNNKIAPENLLKQYPADVIRYWTASARLGHDVAFSENQLKIGMRLLTKIWNAFRFIGEHTQEHSVEPERFDMINQWLLHALSECLAKYQGYFDNQEFGLALDTVERFFWHDFCDNYLELVKDQLFKPEKYEPWMVAGTRWTLYTVGFSLLQLYAPYLPHVTETIYQHRYLKTHKEPSLHTTHFAKSIFSFPESAALMSLVNCIVADVRKLKTAHKLALNAPLNELVVGVSDIAMIESLKALEDSIKGVTHAQMMRYEMGQKETSLELRDGAWYAWVHREQ